MEEVAAVAEEHAVDGTNGTRNNMQDTTVTLEDIAMETITIKAAATETTGTETVT